MRSALLVFLFAVSLLGSAQEKVYVPFFQVENCPIKTGRTATYLFVDYINKYGLFEALVSEKRDSTLFEQSLNEVKESAELLSTSYYTVGRLIRMGEVYHISISLYTSSGNLEAWTAQRETNDIGDLPAILDYLAFHLGKDDLMSQKGDVYRVNGAESNRVRKIRSNKSFGLLAGAMVPMSGQKVENVNGGFGVLASFDTRSYILQLSGELFYGNDSVGDLPPGHHYKNRYFNVAANVLYPLTSTNNAPFVCLGSAFTYRETVAQFQPPLPRSPSREQDIVDAGLTISGGGGYLLKRNADAQLFIYARGFVYVPNINELTYGAMLTMAITVGN